MRGICRGCGQEVEGDHAEGRGHTVPDTCPGCGGAGFVTFDGEDRPWGCSTCDGAGHVAASCGPIEPQ